MDVLANHSIFQELQLVHDTGYFSAMPSLEENWQQVCVSTSSSSRSARSWMDPYALEMGMRASTFPPCSKRVGCV